MPPIPPIPLRPKPQMIKNGLKYAEEGVHIYGKPYTDLSKSVIVKSLTYYENRVIGLGSSHTVFHE